MEEGGGDSTVGGEKLGGPRRLHAPPRLLSLPLCAASVSLWSPVQGRVGKSKLRCAVPACSCDAATLDCATWRLIN